MKKYLLLICLILLPGLSLAGGMEDDPVLAKLLVKKLEWRAADDKNRVAWDAEFWLGKDLDKLWLKTTGETKDGKLDAAELQVLYDRAVAPDWDLQAGYRRDMYQEPGKPDREWLAVGFEGLAPYDFDIETALFVGDEARTSFRLDAEYELLLTQRLILTPEAEINLFGKNDPATRTGSGLSTSELGLRLRYEIRREFAPYIGVNWEKLYGKTRDYAREDGDDTDDVQFVVGVRMWF